MKKYSEIVISAFATYTRTNDLMKATGLSRKTIDRYRKDSELLEVASVRRMDVIRESVYKMQSELTKCVDTLTKIRDDEEVSPQTRLYACNCLLNQCKEYTVSVDILNRLEALEKREE